MLLLKQRGVGLIEILVTILVIAIGLLGLVGMQMASMKNVSNANHRALATIATYDMAERMRSDPAGVRAGDYDAIRVREVLPVPPCDPCPGADRNAADWWAMLHDSFPAGFTATVTSSGDYHDITVSWTELAVDSENPASAPDFTLRVQVYVP